MRRGELYRVYKAAARDPRRYRVFVVVSRQPVDNVPPVDNWASLPAVRPSVRRDRDGPGSEEDP